MKIVKAIFKYEYDESVVQLEEMKLPQEGAKESLLDEDGLMTLDVTGKNPGRTELKGKLVLISDTWSRAFRFWAFSVRPDSGHPWFKLWTYLVKAHHPRLCRPGQWVLISEFTFMVKKYPLNRCLKQIGILPREIDELGTDSNNILGSPYVYINAYS